MKTLFGILFLLTACRSTTDAQLGQEDLEARAGVRAIAFTVALDARDHDAVAELSSNEARPYFEAQRAIHDLELAPPVYVERATLPPAELVSISRDGERAVVVITWVFDSDDPAENPYEMKVHLVLEGGKWGVRAVEDEHQLRCYADLVPEAEQLLASMREYIIPHPDLAPPVTAYLAAASERNEAAMTAVMTAACATNELQREDSPTADLLAGRMQVTKWYFVGRGTVEGDGAEQLILGNLLLDDGRTVRGSILFRFARLGDTWRISALER